MSVVIPYSRDADGLISSIHHVRHPDQSINWQAMLKPEHLYVRPEAVETLLVQFNVKSKWDLDVTKCKPNQLLVTLAGINYLAYLRGLKSVVPTPFQVTESEVVSTCQVAFIPNFENPEGLTVGAQASASLYSVSGSFQLYLATIAQNRAFVRAVRQALRIEILGNDELDNKANKAFEAALESGQNPLLAPAKTAVQESTTSSAITGVGLLADKCKARKISFDSLRVSALKIITDLNSDPNLWTDFRDIPPLDSYTLLRKIEEAETDKKGKK